MFTLLQVFLVTLYCKSGTTLLMNYNMYDENSNSETNVINTVMRPSQHSQPPYGSRFSDKQWKNNIVHSNKAYAHKIHHRRPEERNLEPKSRVSFKRNYTDTSIRPTVPSQISKRKPKVAPRDSKKDKKILRQAETKIIPPAQPVDNNNATKNLNNEKENEPPRYEPVAKNNVPDPRFHRRSFTPPKPNMRNQKYYKRGSTVNDPMITMHLNVNKKAIHADPQTVLRSKNILDTKTALQSNIYQISGSQKYLPHNGENSNIVINNAAYMKDDTQAVQRLYNSNQYYSMGVEPFISGFDHEMRIYGTSGKILKVKRKSDKQRSFEMENDSPYAVFYRSNVKSLAAKTDIDRNIDEPVDITQTQDFSPKQKRYIGNNYRSHNYNNKKQRKRILYKNIL